MKYNFKNNVELFMITDILGDTIRTGLLDWKISRETLNTIKAHTFDLGLIYRLIEDYLPDVLDSKKINDYIDFHDLPEAITGDITKFEGVSEEEINRVTNLSIDFLVSKFKGIVDLKTILYGYENKVDIEAKVVYLLDKMHSAIEFIKYQSENEIDINHPEIMDSLKSHPFVIKLREEGKDVADIFYEYHKMAINISDEECDRYNISKEDADTIVKVCQSFFDEIYDQKVKKTLFDVYSEFPVDAMKYNRNRN